MSSSVYSYYRNMSKSNLTSKNILFIENFLTIILVLYSYKRKQTEFVCDYLSVTFVTYLKYNVTYAILSVEIKLDIQEGDFL